MLDRRSLLGRMLAAIGVGAVASLPLSADEIEKYTGPHKPKRVFISERLGVRKEVYMLHFKAVKPDGEHIDFYTHVPVESYNEGRLRRYFMSALDDRKNLEILSFEYL